MGIAFSVSEPEKLAFAGIHLGERGCEEGLGFMLGGVCAGGEEGFGEIFNGGCSRLAPVVTQEVGTDAEEIAALGDFAFFHQRSTIGAEEADVGFLHEIVGKRWIAGDAGEIGPEGTRRSLVEGCEGVIVHFERSGKRQRFAGLAFGGQPGDRFR